MQLHLNKPQYISTLNSQLSTLNLLTMYNMAKVCQMYLALCLVSGFFIGNAAGIFEERIMNLVSFKYTRCEPAKPKQSYNFTLLDFHVDVDNCGDIHFTGSFMTKINITSPLMATVVLEKSIIFGLMFNIPCFGSFGSCSADDLCEYGVPEGLECPPNENEVNFPCRCPVEPGIYRLPGVWISDLAKTKWAYVFSGHYTAEITLYQGSTAITCYKIEFSLE